MFHLILRSYSDIFLIRKSFNLVFLGDLPFYVANALFNYVGITKMRGYFLIIKSHRLS